MLSAGKRLPDHETSAWGIGFKVSKELDKFVGTSQREKLLKYFSTFQPLHSE